MKAFKIDVNGVTEVNADESQILVKEICWDCVGLNPQHDIWVDDEGLFKPKLALARIGHLSGVPLPAYVCGVEGERAVDATIGLDDLRAIVTISAAP